MKKQSKNKKRRRIRTGRVLMLVAAALSVVLLCLVGINGLVRHFTYSDEKKTPAENNIVNTDQNQNQPEPQAPLQPGEVKSFSFVGFGDNLLHDPIFIYHEQDTGNRDYSGIYAPLLPYINGADVSYINFETICAGDEYGLTGYPAFNGPLEMLDTLNTVGFDVFSCASNHSLDRREEGLATELTYIATNFPNIAVTGARADQSKADEPVVMDVNGIKVGLAGFTYGTNGIPQAPGMEWMLDVYADDAGNINYPLIDKRIDALNATSDVQIVTMHWGQEYQTTPNDQQLEVAKYLHNKGVEVIVGTHPHVIQTAEIMKTGNQETLIYYSLGNLLSAQNHNYTMVGGMANFTLKYDTGTHITTFENPTFTPTVTWISPDLRNYQTLTIHEYTDEMAAGHYIPNVEGEDLSRGWVQSYVAEVFGTPEGIQLINE